MSTFPKANNMAIEHKYIILYNKHIIANSHKGRGIALGYLAELSGSNNSG